MEFYDSRLQLFNTLFLSALPENVRNYPSATNRKNCRCLVRVVPNQNVAGVSIYDMTDANNEHIIEMRGGSTHLVPFNSVQDKIEAGRMDLL